MQAVSERDQRKFPAISRLHRQPRRFVVTTVELAFHVSGNRLHPVGTCALELAPVARKLPSPPER